MMRPVIIVLALAVNTPVLATAMIDDPLLTMVKVDQLEVTDISGENRKQWEAQAWLGKDLNKVWLKTEGEMTDGHLHESEFQLLYSRAIAPFWDMQLGWRYDSLPQPHRHWLVAGVKGLAPYFFETDIAVFLNEAGVLGLRGQFEYELLFTQKWILTPELKVNLYSKNDPAVSRGSGLADMKAGLRLRYEITREFAPYLGVEWQKQFGQTADYAKDERKAVEQTYWVAGIKFWF